MMKDYLERIDRRIYAIIRKIGREADRQGVAAYLVGGIVRDLILGRDNWDVDIVMESDAVRFAQGLAEKFGIHAKMYKEFGTATLAWPMGLRIDCATARQECYPHPGALPVVSRGTLKDDLFRRDFTINAMAMAINQDRFGQLVDEFDGLSDLRGKKIRILHEGSFTDDPTRILRAVRFEQRLRFHIEGQTLRLLKQALRQKVFDKVKPPRYFTEFRKMLSEEEPLAPLKRLKSLGAMSLIDPAWKMDFGILAQIQRRVRRLPRNQSGSRWLLYLMASAQAVPSRKLDGILRKFHLNNDTVESVAQASRAASLLRKLGVFDLSRSGVYRILKPLRREVVAYLRLRASQKRIAQRIDRYLRYDASARLDINGEDLKRMGVKPGKEIGTILEKILDMKIDGLARGRKAQMNVARTFPPKADPPPADVRDAGLGRLRKAGHGTH